jgi:hypothetical protein
VRWIGWFARRRGGSSCWAVCQPCGCLAGYWNRVEASKLISCFFFWVPLATRFRVAVVCLVVERDLPR